VGCFGDALLNRIPKSVNCTPPRPFDTQRPPATMSAMKAGPRPVLTSQASNVCPTSPRGESMTARKGRSDGST